tara:strand:- start:476 stop:775 length:300 start_codon:yes stop_codon:yes gene_type:complete
MAVDDLVSRPAHYTAGRYEAIDVIEDAVQHAPDPASGFLLGNTLKYLLRAWLKGNTIQDLCKARWYLNRLIDRLEAQKTLTLQQQLVKDAPPPFDDPLQ